MTQEPRHCFCPPLALWGKKGVLLVLLGGREAECKFQWRRPSLGRGMGMGGAAGERLPRLPASPRSHPKTQRGDEAAQRTCAGLLSYYTWATPVTVKATPSAVSTSSQRGCNVIISREILPRNAKQGPWVWGPRAWGVGKDFDISLRRLGRARGVLLQETEGVGSPRGRSWECVRRGVGRQGQGADGSVEGVSCATHVHVCPLLTSAWLEERERK